MRMTRWPLLLLAAWIAAPAYASQQSSPLEGIYTIQQKANGRYVDAWADKRHDYGLVTRDKRQPDGSQDWVLKHLGGNEYTIQQTLTGRYVDAWGDKGHDYGLVTRDKRQTDGSQDWVLVPLGSNEYTVQQKLTGRYVDAWADKGHDYGLVTRDKRQPDGSQDWVLTRVGAKLHPDTPGETYTIQQQENAPVLTSGAAETLEGIYWIRQKANDRYVDAWADKDHDYGLVTRKEKQPDGSQDWVLKRLQNNEYTIQQTLTGRYVDAYTENVRRIVTRDQRQTDGSQDWVLVPLGSDQYTIQQKSTTRYVDAWKDGTHDYALVTQDQRQTDGSQDWVLSRACNPLRRFDYVYVKRSGGGLTLVPTEAEVIRDWKYDDPAPGCKNLATDLSDHYPVRVRFSVSGAPCAIRDITVLTYNTHLFHGDFRERDDTNRKLVSRGAFAEMQKRRVTIYQDVIRRKAIADRVRGSRADIVGLQEVWEPEFMRYFAQELKDIYPHSYFVEDNKGLRSTSGLVLLSKLPIKTPQLRVFPIGYDPAGVLEGSLRHSLVALTVAGLPGVENKVEKVLSHAPDDALARKGVVNADIELCEGVPPLAVVGASASTIRLGLSHALVEASARGSGRRAEYRTSDQDSLFDIQIIIDETIRNDSPAIMMGDFNVHHEYKHMNDLFKAASAGDAYSALHTSEPRDAQTDDPDAQTSDPCRNTLNQVFQQVSGAHGFVHEALLDWRRGQDFKDVAEGKKCIAAFRSQR